MLKQTAVYPSVNRVAGAAFAAPRQVWLAGLGAAIATREWARNDVGHVFKTLVKQGSQVETRAIHTIGRRIDSSIVQATTAWNRAREAGQAIVKGLVEAATTAFPNLKAGSVNKHAVKDAAKPAAKKPRVAAKRAASRRSKRRSA